VLKKGDNTIEEKEKGKEVVAKLNLTTHSPGKEEQGAPIITQEANVVKGGGKE